MRIEHLAIWTKDLDKMKNFYVRYFNMQCGEKYTNPVKNFSSYFLSFRNESTRIELMHDPTIKTLLDKQSFYKGVTHFSISVGNKAAINSLTELLRSNGYVIVSEPRTTGDGYYESVIEDCEGNRIEITE
ncbi:MAG: VOC family protein [Paludibacter sp.]|nr:VOC family protein [Paludibacter sp.]